MCGSLCAKEQLHSWLCIFCIMLCIHCQFQFCEATNDVNQKCPNMSLDGNNKYMNYLRSRYSSKTNPPLSITLEGMRRFMCGLGILCQNETSNPLDDASFPEECYSADQLFQCLGNPASLNETQQQSLFPVLLFMVDSKACEHTPQPKVPSQPPPPMWKVWLLVLAAVTVISAVGLFSVALIPMMHQAYYNIIIQFLIALAVGSLVGDAFLHLIPHALFPHETADKPENEPNHSHSRGNKAHKEAVLKTLMGAAGVLVFFVAERIVIVYQGWRAQAKYSHHRSHDDLAESNGHNHKEDKHHHHHHHHHHKSSTQNMPIVTPDKLELQKNDDAEKQDWQKSVSPVLIETNNTQDSLTMPLVAFTAFNADTSSHNGEASPKKHGFGWGCNQHGRALRAAQQMPEKHSASTPFSGICNQRDTFQANIHCVDPMDEENCLKEGQGNNIVITESAKLSILELDVKPPTAKRGSIQSNPLALEHTPHGHHHGHSHNLSSIKSIAYTILAGDGLHNFCDGIAIGAAFQAGISDGFAVSLAVLCHELPHELGDFAVLLHAGISVRLALFYNLFSSILCYLGALIGLWVGNHPAAVSWIFMFTAGMFFYIALVDMVPELTTQRLRGTEMCAKPIVLLLLQTTGIVLGVISMLFLSLYEDQFH